MAQKSPSKFKLLATEAINTMYTHYHRLEDQSMLHY